MKGIMEMVAGHLAQESKTSLAMGIIGVLLGIQIAKIIYRLTLHPLAKFPGPRLGAMTNLYNYYHEVIVRGKGSMHSEELHKIYGPIIRIKPNKLHINDPEFYRERKIYSMTSGFTKAKSSYHNQLPYINNIFSEVDPVIHRKIRGALNPMFSKQAVHNLEDLIQQKIDLLCHHMTEYAEENKKIDWFHATRALTVDIITQYAFATSYNQLDNPGFQSTTVVALEKTTKIFYLYRETAGLSRFIEGLPIKIQRLLFGNKISGLSELLNGTRAQVERILNNPKSAKSYEHATLFDHLLDYYKTRTPETARYFEEEALVIVAAGTETTGHTLATGVFRILENPRVLATLKKELKEAIPNPQQSLGWRELEKLPYLSAVIKETLRMAHGVLGDLPRVAPAGGVDYDKWHIPAGAEVTMCSYSLHTNEEIFPDSSSFRPERWLEPNAKGLDKYLVPFSTGPRACIGINLAWAELYMAFGTIMRRFDFTPVDFKISDLEPVDRWVGAMKKNQLYALLSEVKE